ncbi:DUF1598 domain-containing protein [Blastopirellula sp. JC732]|uniref:DUF1598 domain-containing protein n=1 Tax=Blastopirellula sediminis TaxID=2894196 RepID=A0A9X1SH47_9BACT|nr:DUF1598 domain-containing protein [Blastopirellula sediminis]MCC9607009.1 DUF1598 domain-containing protein [Blastopirellula sediminis]MCC9629697.1 DUF1598 domain-containing protein [Blastopirellula sediminis]
MESRSTRLFHLLLATFAVGLLVAPAAAQTNNNNNFQQSGVYVDAQGVLRMQQASDPTGQLMRQRVQAAKATLAPELTKPSELRMISLNRLEAALAKATEENNTIPEEMKNLAGLTQLKYVFFYPESGDIVIAGPAEGFVSDLTGRAVGTTSGKAILSLDDMIVALRAYAPGTKGVNFVGVSIDPTKEGLKNYQEYLRSVGTDLAKINVATLVPGMQQALGKQDVTVTGISPKTNFAKTLVEADYRMKLIGIGLERPPVRIPSYTEKSRGGSKNALQRWFFTPNYECVKLSEDGLAMELVGEGVKLIGENEMVTRDGGRVQSGGEDPASRMFTMAFTKAYPELAKRSPVYAQMRNQIDMLIAAAYIQEYDLYGQAHWNLGVFNDESRYPVEVYNAPNQVETAVNAVWKGNRLVTPIGGGVSIKPKYALLPEQMIEDENGALEKERAEIKVPELAPGQWWWD